MRPWFERRPLLLASEKEAVAAGYSTLYFVVAEGVARVRGGLPIRVGSTVVDHFQIEVRLADDHPTSHPVAREVGGRIAPLSEHHLNDDGQICLFLPEEAYVHWGAVATVHSFLEGPVNSYFVGYLHYRAFGIWPFGERRHGLDGSLDFYQERSGITTPDGVVSLIELLARGRIKGHWPCPCGSNLPIRSCHPGALNLRETVSTSIAEATLGRVREALRKAADSV